MISWLIMLYIEIIVLLELMRNVEAVIYLIFTDMYWLGFFFNEKTIIPHAECVVVTI